jgi:UDP-glucuronate 4-epimerase
VRPSVLAPAEYMDVNACGTAMVLEAARRHEVERLVFASSSSVYGGDNALPFRDDQPVAAPLSPYAASKIAGEAMCHAHHHLYGMPIVCLRFFTVYGPRQRPDLAINKFLRLLLADGPISIYGDGTASRDYTYVTDIVSGVRAALESDLSYEVINLGDSSPVTVRDLVAQLERVTGRTARLEYVDTQPGDMPHTYACTEKARTLLNWRPQTMLAEGLRAFVEWYDEGGTAGHEPPVPHHH